MNTLQYTKPEVVRLREYHDEKWLQERIEQDPSILGLGELANLTRERRQPTGGRIDFLMHDPETQTMFEVEVMLGALNESHIIRAIEYWDNERRRFPSKEHKAVIVAEDITNRFFNVIYLMNKSIPIIALQLTAFKLEEKLLLTFTKVLDVFEEPEDDEPVPSETVNRGYYDSRYNKGSLAIMDKILNLAKGYEPQARITFNKYHVAVGTSRRNFCWCHPRKSEAYCFIDVRVGEDNVESTKKLLADAALSFTNRKEDLFSFALQEKVFEANRESVETLIRIGWDSHQ